MYKIILILAAIMLYVAQATAQSHAADIIASAHNDHVAQYREDWLRRFSRSQNRRENRLLDKTRSTHLIYPSVYAFPAADEKDFRQRSERAQKNFFEYEKVISWMNV